MTTKRTKSWGRKPSDANPKVSVAEIVVDKIIERINKEGKLPWQKPFLPPAINWVTGWEYTGINVLLLQSGEYITKKQLLDYNKKHGTSFWFKKGSKTEVVTYFNRKERALSTSEFEQFKSKNPNWAGKCYPTDKGWVVLRFVQAYHRVFNINDIEDKEGNKLEPKLGETIVMECTKPQEIVDKYTQASGVKVNEVPNLGQAYYNSERDDVTIATEKGFKSTEGYYRTLFHELIHSTGHKDRLNRETLYTYHEGLGERSKEELIAELGAVLVASEAGFKDEDNEYFDNSVNYIAGWCKWMKDNPRLVMSGATQAQKAANYVISGCEVSTGGSQRSTDGDGKIGEEEGLTDSDLVADEKEGNKAGVSGTKETTPEGEGKQGEPSNVTGNTTSKDKEEIEVDETLRDGGVREKAIEELITLNSSLSMKEKVKLVTGTYEAKLFKEKVLRPILEGDFEPDERKEYMKQIHISQLAKVYVYVTGDKEIKGKKKSELVRGIMD